MYNQELERLIEVCLADGILTDKEKEVICKKADSLGIDRVEVMVYVDGLLDERAGKTKSNKEGNIRICPNCGANLPGLVANCPECGHELRGTKVSDSVEAFSRKYHGASTDGERAAVVDSFQIPSNKEDLLEFMAIALPMVKKNRKMPMALAVGLPILGGVVLGLVIALAGGGSGLGLGLGLFLGVLGVVGVLIAQSKKNTELYKAWKAKLANLFMKSEMLESSDASFAARVKNVTKEYSNHQRIEKISQIAVYSLIAVMIIVTLCIGSKESDQQDVDRLKVTELINEGKYNEADEIEVKILPSGNISEANHEYYNFLDKCITRMCEAGEYDQAQLFMEAKVKHFREKNWQTEYDEIWIDDAREGLQNIIDTYKNK